MLNLRKIDSIFWLSGGWTDVPEDAEFLNSLRITSVLDLQMTDLDAFFTAATRNISEQLTKYNINYAALPMKDGANSQVEQLFENGHNILSLWEENHKKGKGILVKCGVGVSRSPAMLIYHYGMRDRLTYEEAKNRLIKQDYLQNSVLPLSPHPLFVFFLKTKLGSEYA